MVAEEDKEPLVEVEHLVKEQMEEMLPLVIVMVLVGEEAVLQQRDKMLQVVLLVVLVAMDLLIYFAQAQTKLVQEEAAVDKLAQVLLHQVVLVEVEQVQIVMFLLKTALETLVLVVEVEDLYQTVDYQAMVQAVL